MSSEEPDIMADGTVTHYAESPSSVTAPPAFSSLLDSVLAATPAVASHFSTQASGKVSSQSSTSAETPLPTVGPLDSFRSLAQEVIARFETDPDTTHNTRKQTEGLDQHSRDRRESAQKLLSLWYGDSRPENITALRRSFQSDIARIDDLIEKQVNAILHHERFQQLEASWSGLRWLVNEVPDGANIRVRALNVKLRELSRDLERAVDFDQSSLFQKIYEDEFGTPGGEPYGLLIGDYELAPGRNLDHLETLRQISHTAAAAFAPFITGTAPEMFGLSEYRLLERSIDYGRLFSQKSYLPWRSFRNDDDSRFVALTLPRVLRRLPHNDTALERLQSSMGFVENRYPNDIPIRFREDVSKKGGGNYLWGNAAYALGGVVVRAFADTGWFADIRGVQRDVEGGGLVTTLPSNSFGTDRSGLIPKTSTNVIVTDMLEKTLADQGFISLCHCKDTEYSAFYSTPSIQKARQYDTLSATMNARISAMLQYMLCASRFAHYVKCIVRDNVGSFKSPEDCERLLEDWLADYVTDADASSRVKAGRPLREASVQVREIPGKPGAYDTVIRLWPHYELDELVASVQLRTQVSQRKR
ncbi:MAG: type VI secretion system protein ImpD [Planctomycetaceae bacterium]|jgi:type VI secretion system protein ImpD